MDTTPLPIQECEQSDNGLTYEEAEDELATYVVRITPCEKFTFEQVTSWLKDQSHYLKFVIGKESIPREHFHIVLQTDLSVELEDVRADLRSYLIPFWQNAQFKLPKGFGNKQYNLQVSEDVDKAVSYAVKKGEIVFEGFTEEYITLRRAESFDKKKPSNFRSEYIDLSNRFQESTMDIREFMIEYCNLKARYDQQVVMSHVYAIAISQLIKRDNNAEEFVENFLYKH